MKLSYNIIFLLVVVSATLFLSNGCKDAPPSEKMAEYIRFVEEHRTETDDYMKNNSKSPFHSKSKVEFEPLKYFPVDTTFIYESPLTLYETPDTINVFGTKGEERSSIRYGYLTFERDEKTHKVNVYKNMNQYGDIYFSIWFTDKTTGSETYGVGRYLNIDITEDPDWIYTLDFNFAYNPYCAYSSDFSCAVPTKEDYLDLAITAGEKIFREH